MRAGHIRYDTYKNTGGCTMFMFVRTTALQLTTPICNNAIQPVVVLVKFDLMTIGRGFLDFIQKSNSDFIDDVGISCNILANEKQR